MSRREGAWAWSEYESYVMTILVMGYAYGCIPPLFIVIFVRRGIVDAKVRLSERTSTTGTNLILTFDGDPLIRQQSTGGRGHHDIRVPVEKMLLLVMFHFILHNELCKLYLGPRHVPRQGACSG